MENASYKKGEKARSSSIGTFMKSEQKCILSEGRWFSFTGFTFLGEKKMWKNWRTSIFYNGTPLQKVVEQKEYLQKKKRSVASQQQDSDSDDIQDEDDDENDDEDDEVDDEDDDENEDDDEDDDDMNMFDGPTLPVTCGSDSGLLHKKRFTGGHCGRCIRTENSWLTPEDFIRSSKPGGIWRKDIVSHGLNLGKLIREKVLKLHKVDCDCEICEDPNETQRNDDTCFECDAKGELVYCDECPRAFHPECHQPPVDEDSPESEWSCRFCEMKKVNGSSQKSQQDVLSSSVSQYTLRKKKSLQKERCEKQESDEDIMDNQDEDEDEDADVDMTVFEGPALPVTSGSDSGLLHKDRFAGDPSSSSDPLTKEIQCLLCLDVFTDPVTVSCGHNFCKSCLIQCWDSSEDCYCPYCKEPISKRLKLQINTALEQVTQSFKKKSGLKKCIVLCDICDESKRRAVKSCLMCQSSYCETHLEPHHRVPRLKKHKLINAVENLDDYICEKHERPLELFCRDDQTCVCPICILTEHKNHNTVPLEEESEQKKIQVVKIQTDVQMMIQDRMKKIQDIKKSRELRKQNMEKEKADRVELFRTLQRSIDRCQTEMLKMMEEQQKTAEKQEEDQIEELQQEINELKRREEELEQISHTEDHLHLIQTSPFLPSSFSTKNWPEISVNTTASLNTIRTALMELQKTLDEKLSITELKKMHLYAVDVTLDPETAHPLLIVSDDGKQVRRGDVMRNVPDNPKRFDCCVTVLGKEGFSSGRFYYEVQVKNKTEWNLGVARESVLRKRVTTLSPEDGYWTIRLRNRNEYKALTDPPVFLSLRVNPQTVGVFVDYEEGLVSFYDVESQSHICSFSGQTFTEKLYPYFCPGQNTDGKNSAPLIISPVRHIE